MNFLKLAKTRKSTLEFSDKPVSQDRINKILEAGRWAPSSLNLQPWKFIIVKDKQRINNLMKYCAYGLFHTSPQVIIALILDSDYLESKSKATHRGVKEGKIGVTEGLISIATPAMNMTLEAQDIGVNSCLLTPIEDEASKILKLRSKDRVPIMIGFGYESKKAFKRIGTRKELKDLVYNETYGGKSE